MIEQKQLNMTARFMPCRVYSARWFLKSLLGDLHSSRHPAGRFSKHLSVSVLRKGTNLISVNPVQVLEVEAETSWMHKCF